MDITTRTERKLLTGSELELIDQSHLPQLRQLSDEELRSRIRLARDYRDKFTTRSRKQRREIRGKAEPSGARPAEDNRNTVTKKRIFSKALIRFRRELDRRGGAEEAADTNRLEV